MGETKMRALLLLFGILQSSTGRIAPETYVEYDEQFGNISIIYDENSEAFFPFEDYYDDNSTYYYENSTADYELYTLTKNITNSAPLYHSPLFFLTLLHILHFLRQDFQM